MLKVGRRGIGADGRDQDEAAAWPVLGRPGGGIGPFWAVDGEIGVRERGLAGGHVQAGHPAPHEEQSVAVRKEVLQLALKMWVVTINALGGPTGKTAGKGQGGVHPLGGRRAACAMTTEADEVARRVVDICRVRDVAGDTVKGVLMACAAGKPVGRIVGSVQKTPRRTRPCPTERKKTGERHYPETKRRTPPHRFSPVGNTSPFVPVCSQALPYACWRQTAITTLACACL